MLPVHLFFKYFFKKFEKKKDFKVRVGTTYRTICTLEGTCVCGTYHTHKYIVEFGVHYTLIYVRFQNYLFVYEGTYLMIFCFII